MHRQPNVVEYVSDRMPRRSIDWLRFAPLFAFLCAVFAWLKSVQYHDYGQLRDEQITVLSSVILSVACLILTFFRFRRYRSDGRRKLIAVILLCAVVLACDGLAIWNLNTAAVGAKDRLF